MTDKVFNLQVKLSADSDRGRRENKHLLEHLLGDAIRQVLPEAIVLKVSMNKISKKK